jgi:hypothetical protein
VKQKGIPLTSQKWFKNSKLDEVPWHLFVTSRKIDCCDKGILVSLLKVRWHGILAVLKQFITCEGHYGLAFLYHVVTTPLLYDYKQTTVQFFFYFILFFLCFGRKATKMTINHTTDDERKHAF